MFVFARIPYLLKLGIRVAESTNNRESEFLDDAGFHCTKCRYTA